MKKFLVIIPVLLSCNIPSGKSPHTASKSIPTNTATEIVQTCLDSMYQDENNHYKWIKKYDSLNKTNAAAGYHDYQTIILENHFLYKNPHLDWNKEPITYEPFTDTTNVYGDDNRNFIKLDSLTYDSAKASIRFSWLTKGCIVKFRLAHSEKKWRVIDKEYRAAQD